MPIKGENGGYKYKAFINGEWHDLTLADSPNELTEWLKSNEEWARIVRCKDCKHNYYNMIPSGETEHECVKCVELPITADFYCAWGERKDEAD